MRTIKIITAISAVILLIYGTGWYYVMNKINAVFTKEYAKKQLFLPDNLFKNELWEQLSTKKDADIKQKTIKDIFLYFVFSNELSNFTQNNPENYHITFKESYISGFPFNLQLNLVNFVEHSVQADVIYQQPVTIGYNIITNNLYAQYNGKIIANLEPKATGAQRLISLDATIETPIAKKVMYDIVNGDTKYMTLTIIKNINYINKTITDLVVEDSNTKQILFDATKIVDKVEIFHYYDYQTFDDLIKYAPKKYVLNSIYDVTTPHNIEQQPLFSIITLLTYYAPESLISINSAGYYKQSSTCATYAKDWTDINDIISNIDCNISHSFTAPTKDKRTLDLKFSLLNPQSDKYDFKYKIKYLADYGSKTFFNDFVTKTESFYKKRFKHNNHWSSLDPLFKKYYSQLPENNNILLDIDLAGEIDKQKIDVDLKTFTLDLNHSGFNINNKTAISKTSGISAGKITILDTVTISNIIADIVAVKSQLNNNENQILQSAILDTMNFIAKKQNNNEGIFNLITEYKVSLLSQEIGGYSLQKIRENLKNNLLDKSKQLMSEEDFKRFVEKLSL
jgi:hypothetical protein